MFKKYSSKPCPCGSDLDAHEVSDARGIYIGRMCDKCEKERLKGFRKDVLEDPHYWHDEPLDED